MPPPSAQRHLKSTKIAVWFVTLLLLVLGLLLTVQGFIDTHNYRDRIIATIKEKTGREVSIRGSVTVSLVPAPTLYIQGLELRDDSHGDKPIPAATVEMTRIRVSFLSVLSEYPDVSAIILERPVLDLTRAKNNVIHWDWLNAGLLKAFNGGGAPGKALSLDVIGGKINYYDNRTQTGMIIDNIAVSAESGQAQSMAGSFRMAGRTLSFAMDTDPSAAAHSGDVPFLLQLNAGEDGEQSTARLEGNFNFSGDLPEIKGKLDLELDNLMNWVKEKNSEDVEMVLDQATQTLVPLQKEAVRLPMKMSGEWAQTGLSVKMDKVEFDGMNSKGAGTIELGWKDRRPVIAARMKFSAMRLDQWKALLAPAFKQEEDTYGAYRSETEQENPLPGNMQLTLDIQAEQLSLGTRSWENGRLSADMADGVITVNQCAIALPGDSLLTLFGIVSPSPTNDLRFEGSVETHGASLKNMLTVFDDAANELPEAGFGKFGFRSNIFISSEQLRLSEADVKLSDLYLNGGLVAYFDERTRLEADVKLDDINFDYFRDVWREHEKEKSASEQQDFFLQFNKNINFNWLKRLNTIVDFRIKVDGFTFLERRGQTASFRLYARQGDLGVYDINFTYPDDVAKGFFKLDVNGEQPSVSLTMSVGELDTNYFSTQPVAEKLVLEPQSQQVREEVVAPPGPAQELAEPVIPQPSPKTEEEPAQAEGKRWPEELIDMSWMEGVSGSLDLNINKLAHKDVVLDGFRLQSRFEKNLMTFRTLNFRYWGGQISILGSMYGGKVPGMAVSVTLLDAQLHDMLKTLANRDNITGKISISATVNTSGVNYLSWLSQSEGKIVIAGRGVNVQGINLQGVIEAVGVSRTASDVFNNVNLALVKGSTVFSVDGNINLKGGTMKTPGMNLRTDTVLGNLAGEVKLVPWTMELSTLFQFPSLSSETVPTMTVQLSGMPDKAVMRTDTASLEAYVAKRIISK